MLIFIDNVEGNILGFDAAIELRSIEHQCHHIIGFDAVVALDGTTIDVDASGFGCSLDAIARSVVHKIDEKLVYAQKLLTFVGYNSIMLIEFAFSRSSGDFQRLLRRFRHFEFIEIKFFFKTHILRHIYRFQKGILDKLERLEHLEKLKHLEESERKLQLLRPTLVL